MKIICLSLITNKVIITGDEGEAASHEEVLEAVANRTTQIQTLVQSIIATVGKPNGLIQTLPPLPDVDLEVPVSNKTKTNHVRIAGVPIHCIGMGIGYGALATIAATLLLKRK